MSSLFIGAELKGRRLFGCAVGLAVFAFFGGAGVLNAASNKTIIEAKVDGGPWQILSSSMNPDDDLNANIFLSMTGLSTKQQPDSIFRVSASVTSTYPGNNIQTFLGSSSSTIENLTIGVHTITLGFGVVDFALPIAPPGKIVYGSDVSDTVAVAKAENKISFQSFVNQANNLGHLGFSGFTNGLQVLDATQKIQDPLHPHFDSQSSFISALNAPYAINQEIDITLGGSGKVNFSDNTTLEATPEPASIILLGIGGAGMAGFSGWRRRRSAAAKAVCAPVAS